MAQSHSQNSTSLPPKTKPKFPDSIMYIFGNEAAERFSFYGMKTILTVYLLAAFQYTHPQANATTHLFITVAYFMAIFGGFLADWFLGKYHTILWLSIVYCAGHAFLAFFDHFEPGFLIGLLLIGLGSGGIKPCVSANAGDQFDHSNQSLIPRMFNIFYFCINLGSFFSVLLTPILYNRVGPRLAFGIPGILMAIATFIFWLGRKKYVRVPPKGFPRKNFVSINAYMLQCKLGKPSSKSIRAKAEEKFGYEAVDGTIAVWRVLAIFAFIPIFWALYDQNGSEWVIQAQQMNRHFLGIDFFASQIQAVNPILILTLIPVFTYAIYPGIEKLGINFTPLRKIGTGFVVMGFAFLVIYFIQLNIDQGGHPNIGWQVLAYFLLTTSEILVSIVGLEYAYTQAPKSMKSTIMAFFLATVAGGDFLVTLVNENIEHGGFLVHLKNNAGYYKFFLILLVCFTIVYIIVARLVKEKSYLIEKEDEEKVDMEAIEVPD